MLGPLYGDRAAARRGYPSPGVTPGAFRRVLVTSTGQSLDSGAAILVPESGSSRTNVRTGAFFCRQCADHLLMLFSFLLARLQQLVHHSHQLLARLALL